MSTEIVREVTVQQFEDFFGVKPGRVRAESGITPIAVHRERKYLPTGLSVKVINHETEDKRGFEELLIKILKEDSN